MDKMIEISEFNEVGYQPLVSYQSWRVAMLNYIDELLPECIDNFQNHQLTDEVFVLLKGKCILYLAEVDKDEITAIHPINMEVGKLYTIKRGVYHTHTLSQDAKVLIVENDDTSDDNSPKIMIDKSINTQLIAFKEQLWK